jgi:hypothetical protein
MNLIKDFRFSQLKSQVKNLYIWNEVVILDMAEMIAVVETEDKITWSPSPQ